MSINCTFVCSLCLMRCFCLFSGVCFRMVSLMFNFSQFTLINILIFLTVILICHNDIMLRNSIFWNIMNVFLLGGNKVSNMFSDSVTLSASTRRITARVWDWVAGWRTPDREPWLVKSRDLKTKSMTCKSRLISQWKPASTCNKT